MIAKLLDGMKMRCFQRIVRTLSKAGSSFVIVAWNESISIRSINEYQSALPIVQLKSNFFDEYKFTHKDSQLSFEVESYPFKQSLLLSNLSAVTPQEIVLSVSDNNRNTVEKSNNSLEFKINVIDYFEINHIWEFHITMNVTILKAVVDMSTVSSTLTCRCDIFDGIDQIFNKNNMVSLHIINPRSKNSKVKKVKDKKYPVMITTEKLIYDDCLATILKFEMNDKLAIEFDDELFDKHCDLGDSELELSFSLADFLIGIKIGSILSQKVTIHCSSPGNPIVIKSSMPNAASFEMTIASCRGDSKSKYSDDEEINENERTRKRNKNTPIVYAPSESEREKYLKE